MKHNYNFDNIEWEITTACNAACPQCPRNYFGSYTWKSLPIVQVDLEWTKKHFTPEFILKLKKIDFCGTYGDPIMNNNLLPIIDYLKSINKNLQIWIKTNGGIRPAEWWVKLASLLSEKDCVVFGIDGLEDTSHLYRRKVPYADSMKNAITFINAGGNALWSYIVFKHNQHQVEEAKRRSKELGFSDIIVKKTWRFMNKKHEYQNSYPVLDENGDVEYYLEVPTDQDYVNENYQKINFINKKYNSIKEYLKATDITCQHKSIRKIYISAEGMVFPCGWIHDRLYGYEAEQHIDKDKLLEMIKISGGEELINLNSSTIDEIINGEFFQRIQESWTNTERLERCAMLCGSELNGIGSQNQWNPLTKNLAN
jgi:MoaA/NifB/PqqE/SkfB family radical SAM enzyme